MGIAYLLILIAYIGVTVGIYKIIKRFTQKVWIKRLVIAFFILLPTYDIIITQALLFYYCNFTEKEKVYQTVENPQSVYIETDGTYSSYLNYPKQYVLDNFVYELQVKNKDCSISDFSLMDGIVHEKKNSFIHADYLIKIESKKMPFLLRHFIDSKQKITISALKDNKVLGEAIRYISQYPNIVPKSLQSPTIFDSCGTLLDFEKKVFKFNKIGKNNGNK